MNGTNPTPSKPAAKSLYRVRKSWADAKSQIGAYAVLDNAVKACKDGYKVFDESGKQVYPKATTWNRDAVLKAGDTVKSVSCAITKVRDDEVYVPALGGWVPLADVTEAADTKDRKCDDYLATTAARVYLHECKVEAVDAKNNLVKVHGYWVHPDPLMRKE